MRTPPLRIPSSRRGAVAVRVLAAIVAVAALVGLAVAPAFAKEFLLARLDAPISFQSPPGAELLVGLLVTVPDGLSRDPLEGSRIRLRLTGPRGDVTEATARTGSTTGRYVVRIVVPAGGPRHLEVLLPAPSEVPVFLETDPFTFRPIGTGTAQLASSAAVAGPGAPASAAAIAQAASL